MTVESQGASGLLKTVFGGGVFGSLLTLIVVGFVVYLLWKEGVFDGLLRGMGKFE